jgi:hypothetical protein
VFVLFTVMFKDNYTTNKSNLISQFVWQRMAACGPSTCKCFLQDSQSNCKMEEDFNWSNCLDILFPTSLWDTLHRSNAFPSSITRNINLFLLHVLTVYQLCRLAFPHNTVTNGWGLKAGLSCHLNIRRSSYITRNTFPLFQNGIRLAISNTEKR